MDLIITNLIVLNLVLILHHKKIPVNPIFAMSVFILKHVIYRPMKKIIFTLLGLFIMQTMFAQVYDNYLQLDSKQYSPTISDFERLPNNNMVYSLILTDSTKAMPMNSNFYNEPTAKNPGSGILVMSPNNTVAWSYSWMPVNYLNDFIYIYQTLVDNMGNIYLSGRYRGLVDMDPTAGVQMFQQTNPNDVEGFVIKLNMNGNFMWAKKFGNTNVSGMYCDLYLGQVHPNGNLVFGGSFKKSVDFDPGPVNNVINANCYNSNAFFLTLDTGGNFVNVRTLQIDSSASVASFSIDSLGNYYAVYTYSGTIDVDMGAATTSYTLQTGYYNSCIAKYNSNFDLQWSKNFGANLYSPGICPKNNQEFYLYSSFSDTIQLNNNTTAYANGPSDFFVEKWNTSGNCLWSKTMSGNGGDDIREVAFQNGKLYYLYTYADSINTNTGVNDTTLYAAKRDLALSMLNENGTHISTAEVKSDSSISALWTKLRIYNNEIYFYFTGNGIADVNPGPATQNVSATWTSPYTTIVVKWKTSPTAIQDLSKKDAKKIQIWPNPSPGQFNIQSPSDGVITIYNSNGILIHQTNTTRALSTVSFSEYAQGVYYLYFKSNNPQEEVQASKLIFQK